MNAILLFVALLSDPAYMRIETNVKRIENHKLVSCGKETVMVGFGRRRIAAFGLDLRGKITYGNDSFPMTDEITGFVYQVRCNFENNGLLLFIVSDRKSYVISRAECL